jgi:heat shock protein HslJ
MTPALLVALVLSAPAQLPDDLDGTWRIEEVDRIPVLPEAPITVTIGQTRISGRSSCNSFQGTLTRDGTTLKVHGLITTMKACDQARMNQEREFLTLLRVLTGYEILAHGRLKLSADSGKTVIARRQ